MHSNIPVPPIDLSAYKMHSALPSSSNNVTLTIMQNPQTRHKILKKTTIVNHINESYVKAEGDYLRMIDSKYVVKWRGIQMDNKSVTIYMDYCENGDLEGWLLKKELTFDQKMKLFLQILIGLKELHSRFIIHRDLKPPNIFIDGEGNAVIGDLGIAAQTDNMAMSSVGTYGYQAPEVFSYEMDGYNEGVDVFAVGVIAFMIFNKKGPKGLRFPCGRYQNLIQMLKENGGHMLPQIYTKFFNKPLVFDGDIPDDLQEMIRLMLKTNPTERISFLQIYKTNYLNKFQNLEDNITTLKGEYACILDKRKLLQQSTNDFWKLYEEWYLPMEEIHKDHDSIISLAIDLQFYIFFYLVMRKINQQYKYVEKEQLFMISKKMKSQNFQVKKVKQTLYRPLNMLLNQSKICVDIEKAEVNNHDNFKRLEEIARKSDLWGMKK